MKPASTYNPGEMTGKEWIDLMASGGFKAMEIAYTMLPEGEKDDIVNYAKSLGFSVSIHSPYGRNNITDSDTENREKSIAQAKEAIDFAAKHGLGAVTFHPGRMSPDDDSPEEKWELLLKVVKELSLYAKEKKVYVGIENMELRPYELVYTIDDLNRFADFGVDNPFFGVTVDFAHFSSHGILKPDLSKLKLPVHNVHLSQGKDKKMHFPLTVENGMVDLKSVCEVLNDYGYEGHVVFETREQYPESKDIFLKAMGE